MELTLPTIIKGLLSKYETRPSHGLGQNFLIDKRILEKIIESAEIKSTDTLLEVGPGLGTLTQELAKIGERVITVEKDETMIEILKETLKGVDNVEVIQGDILKIEKLEKFKNYKVVANIPYYLTSPLIRKFLESENQPSEMILMLQKEVAQRICPPLRAGAKPRMSILAISVQFYATAQIISNVSKNCFWPAPKVDSAIIKIIPKKDRARVSIDLFFKIVKAGFSQPRKQLASNLSKILKLEKSQTEKWLLNNNIKPTQRAETLSVEDWISLTNTFE